MSKSAFFKGGGSLLANISGGRRQFPATPVKVERLEDTPVSYGVEILTDDYLFSQYTYMTDGRTELQQQYCVLHYM